MSSPNEKSALLLREDGPGGDPAGAAAATASANDAHRTTGTFRSVMALAAAALLVLACAAGVKYQYVSTLRQDDEIAADPMLEVYARTDAWNGRQTCSSCSVVLPSDTYAGRGLGPLIDQADCVVRFNAHHPNISGMSPEDYGSKDDIRVINGNVGMLWEVSDDPCFVDQCRRTFLSWSDGGVGNGFLLGHPNVELLPKLIYDYAVPDAHGTIRGFGMATGGPVPSQATTAFIAILTFKDPRMCGSMSIFGLSGKEGGTDGKADWGYADDPNKPVSDHHNYVLEHNYYKTAIGEKLEGWENVHWVDMDDPASVL